MLLEATIAAVLDRRLGRIPGFRSTNASRAPVVAGAGGAVEVGVDVEGVAEGFWVGRWCMRGVVASSSAPSALACRFATAVASGTGSGMISFRNSNSSERFTAVAVMNGDWGRRRC